MGNKDANLEPDLEAKAIWMKYLPEERVLPYGMKENFWEMVRSRPKYGIENNNNLCRVTQGRVDLALKFTSTR